MVTGISWNEGEIMEAGGAQLIEIPVLIVGGGPVGLSMAILLAHHGVRSLLVEQHPETSRFSKARFINARTMEIFREVGLEPSLRAAAIPHARDVIFAHSLAEKEVGRRPVETMIPEAVQQWSPSYGCTSTQEVFEPILLAQARALAPAQIRFSTQLTAFEQHETYVEATLVHRATGRVTHLRCQYLIAADGGHSQVREALGIRMLGQPVLSNYVNILFRADLSPWVGDREINLCFISNSSAPGVLLNDGSNRWGFMAFYYPEKGQKPEDFTPERCWEIIRTVVGVPDVAAEIDHIAPWNDAALVAEHFYDRRVFLVGDATHLMSPAGGFGMNVGIQDAHNLAWKLAAVLNGWGASALLMSYEAERLPVSSAITKEMMRNVASVRAVQVDRHDSAPTPQPSLSPVQSPAGRPEFFREHGLVFGAAYDSSVIVPDGTPPMQGPNPVTDYLPNARPGSRAPHVWLERKNQRLSTMDLFGQGLVLLTGEDGKAWVQAAQKVGQVLQIPLRAYTIGPEGDLQDPGNIWQAMYGVRPSGAILVRPDGYVAWRCLEGNNQAEAKLTQALTWIIAQA